MKILAIIFAVSICSFGFAMLIQQIRDAMDMVPIDASGKRERAYVLAGLIIMGMAELSVSGVIIGAIIRYIP